MAAPSEAIVCFSRKSDCEYNLRVNGVEKVDIVSGTFVLQCQDGSTLYIPIDSVSYLEYKEAGVSHTSKEVSNE